MTQEMASNNHGLYFNDFDKVISTRCYRLYIIYHILHTIHYNFNELDEEC